MHPASSNGRSAGTGRAVAASAISRAPDRTPFRVTAVDGLRGLAVAGMVVFHLAWDCHAFGLTSVDPNVQPLWHGFGQTVAATFLFLSGVSSGLARRVDASSTRVPWRLLRVAAAACVVTVTTWLFAPQEAIYFGVLHCIVVANIIALLLRSAPSSALLCLGLACLAVPHLWFGNRSGPALAWLGLGTSEPRTLDFRPLFPWLAPVLFGAVAVRTGMVDRLSSGPPGAAVARWMCNAGRHSLPIYLLHQPVMMGFLLAVTYGLDLAPRSPVSLSAPAEARVFLRHCVDGCVEQGMSTEQCRSTCHCVLTGSVEAPEGPASSLPWLPRNVQDDIRRSLRLCLSTGNKQPADPTE